MIEIALLAACAVLPPLVLWTLRAPARWVHLFLATALLLPPLPIHLGNTGPHPALLFAAIGLFAGILFLPAWRLPADLPTFAPILFCLVLFASLPAALFYSGAELAAASLARAALFALAIYVFLYSAWGPGAARDPLRMVRLLYWVALASAAFACLDFYFQFPAPAGFGPQFVWLDSGVFRRAQGVFYEASTLGNFCAFFLTMIAVALAQPRAGAPLRRPALLAGGALFLAALLFSYSRGSLVNLGVSLAALLWLHRARLAPRRALLALPLAAVAAGWAAWRLLPDLTGAWWGRLVSSGEFLFAAPELVFSGRLAAWSDLGAFALNHPWAVVLGIGYKTLPYSDAFGPPITADNMYFSTLLETGIAGLVALLLLHLALLREALRAARSPLPRARFFGAWFFCFWLGEAVQMLSGDLLTYWRVLPVYFWVLAMAIRDAHPVS